MSNAFFTSWALWEKLVFALACGIVVTICIGGGKAAYSHWRLRKYSVVAEKERKEQALHRQMSERRRRGVPRADNIPFGIRAIERGVEVEGVWVSRPNTPEQESRSESAGSSMWSFMPQKAAAPDLERQATAHGEAAPVPTDTRQSRQTVDAVTNDELVPGSRNPREAIPPAKHEKPAKSKCPPPSFAKYTGVTSLYRHSSTISPIEGIAAIHRASVSLHSLDRLGGDSDGSGSSGSDSSDSGPLSAAAPRLLTQQRSTRGRHHSADFTLMNSHRLSQAAETGQLTPRTRRAVESLDVRDLPSGSNVTLHNDLAGYFSFKQPRIPSPNDSTPSSPKIDALPAAVRRSSMPDVTPFTQFVQTAPSSPRPASMQSTDLTNKRPSAPAKEAPSEAPSAYASAQSSPTKPGAPAEFESVAIQIPVLTSLESTSKETGSTKRPSFEKKRRPSQVIRGHGSGFEILQPGSLKPSMPTENLQEKQRVNPPISLHNYRRARSRSSSAGSRRKLQKKRRSSIDSEVSVGD